MTTRRTFTGICPEYNKKVTVTAKYDEVRFNCDPVVHYKLAKYHCETQRDKGCSHEGRSVCPLVDTC